MTFSIGAGVSCNLETLVNTRLLIQANSGAGKSWALRRVLEQTHGHVQHLVIDPEGEFASLRAKFDYVLAARSGGDTVADPRSAKLLAERLLELGVSAILDIYELKPHERVRFVRVFCEALVEAPKALWHPVLVVLDEAHVYCPEQGDAESADAVKGLATRGRKRGFCLVLATQRLSKLHKDAAAECGNKLIGRSSLDIDMKRASDELGFATKEQRLSLRDLKNGEFYAFGQALSTVVTKVHVGTVSTEHPKAGSHLAAVVPPPTKKVLAVLSKLADLPAEAEAREKSIEDLKRDNANLRRSLTEAQKAIPPPAPPVEVPMLKPSEVTLLEDLRTALGDVTHELHLFEAMASELDALTVRLTATPPPPRRAIPATMAAQPRISAAVAKVIAGPPRHVNGSGASTLGNSGLRRILIALAQRNGLTKKQIGVRARLASGSGTFGTYLSKARTEGWIDGDGPFTITEEGLHALGSYDPLPEGPDLLEHWLRELGNSGAARILRALADVYPKRLSRRALGEAANLESGSGTFGTYLSKLRTLELISGKDEFSASEEFFS